MTILVFEDTQVSRLAPITLARTACGITAGSYCLLDLLSTLEQPIALAARTYLRDWCEKRFQDEQECIAQLSILRHGTPVPATKISLAVNARLIPSASQLAQLQKLLADGKPGMVRSDGELVAVVAPTQNLQEIVEQLAESEWVAPQLEESGLPELDADLKLLCFPHDVVQANMSVIQENLAFRLESDRYVQQSDGLFIADNVQLGDHLVIDTSSGPVVIESGASVGPYTLLRGPVFIGSGCRILEHAAIKDEVSLGHTTKIGGEVEAAVVEPFSNKQHHGFLGHSYLGSWINLGAGTCNSDLKNTYGLVNMDYPTSGKTATGMQFLGCVMGDYSKTAINTGIFTGKVIGVCSMMYGFVTSNVPSFVNYARLFGQVATLPPEVMIATQQRMFSRRKVDQGPADIQLIHDMYRLTQAERDRVGDEIAF